MSGMQPTPPHTVERCQLLLEHWRSQLQLSPRDQGLLGGELRLLDRQLQRLQQRRLRIALFGRVGVGKSSLINALIRRPLLATDVAHGSTRHQQAVDWPVEIAGLTRVELVDTPGIDEIDAAGRARLASRVAMGADLVLLVVDSDLTRADLEALQTLLESGKPLQLVLNRSDRWPEQERAELLRSIRARLPVDLPITAAAAAPRSPQIQADGRVRSTITTPQVQDLQKQLCRQLENEGTLLLAIQSLRQADRFQRACQALRLQQHRRTAQSLIGRYAAAKATGVAVNPVMALDMAGGMACDTALVLQLCKLYDLEMSSSGARALLTRLSAQNALLGGTQLGIQLLLGGLRQVLLLAAPLREHAQVEHGPLAPFVFHDDVSIVENIRDFAVVALL